jgi:hypothetical protein
MPFVVKENKPLYPVDVGFFCPDAVVPDPDRLAQTIQQPRFL